MLEAHKIYIVRYRQDNLPRDLHITLLHLSRSLTVSKPGFCPFSNKCLGYVPELQTCPEEDHACEGVEKCCWSECQRQHFCTPPVRSVLDHPGSCPADFCSHNYSAAEICRVDRDCRLDEKCCYDPCQSKRLCRRAEEGLKNTTLSRPGSVQCSFFCPNSRECCDDLERAGFCPRTNFCPSAPSSATSSPAPPEEQRSALHLKECPERSDFQCSEGEKCCWDPCQLKHLCRASAAQPNEHAGSCPAGGSGRWCSGLTNVRACADDVDCSLDSKCCYDSCRRSTVCQPTTLRRPGCTRRCPGSEECCDGGIKPGLCPASARCPRPKSAAVQPSRESECTEDYDCPAAFRCCRDPCSAALLCSATVTRPFEHLGSCPSNISCSTPGIGVRRCSADLDCYSHEKCCTATQCPSAPGYRLCFPAKKSPNGGAGNLPIGPDGGSVSNKPTGAPGVPSTPSPTAAPGCRELCPGSKTECCDDETEATCPTNTTDCSMLLSNKITRCRRHSNCEEDELCCRFDCIRKKACIAKASLLTGVERNEAKVNVSVIFTSLSLTLGNFIADHLVPMVEANKNQINLELIPYTYYFKKRCRYEPEDCEGHKYLACGYEIFPPLQLVYTRCFLNQLTSSNPADAARNCTSGMQAVLTELSDCVSGPKSESLIAAHQARQNELVSRPKPRKLPVVVVNGEDVSPWRMAEKVDALLAKTDGIEHTSFSFAPRSAESG